MDIKQIRKETEQSVQRIQRQLEQLEQQKQLLLQEMLRADGELRLLNRMEKEDETK